jgi:hypothetical protein
MVAIMAPPRIVIARKPRRSRKPLPQKPAPACGPIVRVIHGKRFAPPAESAEAKARADAAFERVMADPRAAARGE